jgi:hypothetical protein
MQTPCRGRATTYFRTGASLSERTGYRCQDGEVIPAVGKGDLTCAKRRRDEDMTTLPIIMDKPVERSSQMPAGWWLLPSVILGGGIWFAVLKTIFF